MLATKKVQETAAVDLGALLDESDGAIVILVAGQTRLVAHRAVLAARSPVFAAMFQHDTLEASTGEVSITDMEGPVLRQLLSYTYTLQAPRLSGLTPQTLAAADKYGLSALKAACEQQLATQLTVENAAATAALAVRHCCPSLTPASVAFIKDHNFRVMATQGWADMMRSHTEDLIEVSRLLAEPPEEIRSLSVEEKGRRLIQAAEEGAVEEIRTLLAAGADLGVRDKYMGTALHCAAREGHVDAVKFLVECGAGLEDRNRKESTPLHLAAWKGHTAVVRLLVACSADPNAKGDCGWTPLHFAASYGHTEVAAALLEAGSDRGARNDRGNTPLDLARNNNHQQIVGILT
ncbi:CARD- and ANK-domain containing inflammasome adapter protein-like [Schistocerca cancellata]|uniref:CARD- and ANK-domain containing inflammasome adapter protein-like n=1 Tax=Schistocerca cancellata TaxID=274614 RepID=UPI002118588A|nr:CARD- and ANK-domain containing inflammasome adapter protein-like [Schistocerca cancellata]